MSSRKKPGWAKKKRFTKYVIVMPALLMARGGYSGTRQQTQCSPILNFGGEHQSYARAVGASYLVYVYPKPGVRFHDLVNVDYLSLSERLSWALRRQRDRDRSSRRYQEDAS